MKNHRRCPTQKLERESGVVVSPLNTSYRFWSRRDRCQHPGEIGALLRREGLYSSHLSTWRRLRREGVLQGLSAQQRGPKRNAAATEQREIAHLQKQVSKLEHELKKAHTIIDVQKKLSGDPIDDAQGRELVMNAVRTLSVRVGVKPACVALRMNRSRYYRGQRPRIHRPCLAPPLKLSPHEYHKAHSLLLCERFVDQAPASIVATLLDEGEYVCSERTMYRILSHHQQLKERRRGHRQVSYTKPELLAIAPNQVWSWDITKLKGSVTWSYFYLYVILRYL